jgi:NAD(P)-dependent dehydrogenase (short-subunit alcohol dehydrogenase family)
MRAAQGWPLSAESGRTTAETLRRTRNEMTTAKTMFVVGAGDSLGSAIVRTFAADGFTVCVSRPKGDKLKPLVEEIKQLGGKAIAFGSDARREDQVIALIDQVERAVGPLEAAVYNVGMPKPRQRLPAE